jgi:hypothetical protein
MEEQNRREREREREYWFQDSLLSHVACFLQREARGSVTFKIVPSYRSAPPPCEVRQHPSRFIHTYARPSDLYPFLKHIHSLPSSNSNVDQTTDWLTDWQTDIFFPLLFSKFFFLWSLFEMRQSMRVGSLSMHLSLSFVNFQRHF